MKRFAKRLTALLLGLMMLCACALAQDGSLLNASDESSYVWIRALATAGDTLYMITDGTLYTYQEGQADAAAQGSVMLATDYGDMTTAQDDASSTGLDAEHMLSFLAGGDRLVSLNQWNGKLFEVKAQDGKIAYEDLATLQDAELLVRQDGEYTYLASVMTTCTVGDGLYVLTQEWDDEGWSSNKLYAISLTDGSAKISAQEHVTQVLPYQDGKLLLTVFDDRNGWDEETGERLKPALYTWDPQSDTVESLGELPSSNANNLAWDAQGQRLVYFDNCRVMGWTPGGEPKQLTYLPSSYVENMAVLGKTVAVSGFNGSGVMLRTLRDDFSTDVSLNLYGGYMDNGVMAFTVKNPTVPVYSLDEYYTTNEALAQAMVSGESTLDVLEMNLSYSNFLTLKAKGYCADLSGYPELVKAVENMLPLVKDAVMQDGKLMAIPLSLYGWGYSVNTDVMEELGLTEEDIPDNYVDLCRFITTWNDEYIEEYPNYLPMDLDGSEADIKSRLFNSMLTDYLYYCQAQGGEVKFDTPMFREMMQALDEMRCDEIADMLSSGDEDDYWSREFLMQSGYQTVGDFSMYGGDSGYNSQQAVFMRLTPESERAIGVTLTVMFINPRCKNMDYAVQLLQCELEAMDTQSRYTMDATASEAVEDPNFEENVANWKKTLETVKQEREKADEADKRDYDDSIAYLQEMIDHQEQYRYIISEDMLKYYHEQVMPYLYVQQPTFLDASSDSQSTELQTLMSRYTDGQISLEQFIRDADKKLRMMQMEDY